jgi:hypothetical protein
MGCGASVPGWQSALVQEWPKWRVSRTPLSGGEYALTVRGPEGHAALLMHVVPWKSSRGYVSVTALTPYSIQIEVGAVGASSIGRAIAINGPHTSHAPAPTCVVGVPVPVAERSEERGGSDGGGVSGGLGGGGGGGGGDSLDGGVNDEVGIVGMPRIFYDTKAKRLAGQRAYKRSVPNQRPSHWDGPSDTVWIAVEGEPLHPPPPAPPAALGVLPDAISVVNAKGRVCVWRGVAPPASLQQQPSAELLALMMSAKRGQLDTSDYMSRNFELALAPALAAGLATDVAALALFLAIAIEGFWSHGSRSHAVGDEVGVRASAASGTVPTLTFSELRHRYFRSLAAAQARDSY